MKNLTSHPATLLACLAEDHGLKDWTMVMHDSQGIQMQRQQSQTELESS